MTRSVFMLGTIMVVGCNAIFGVDELMPAQGQGGTSTHASSQSSTATRAATVSSTAAHGVGGAKDCDDCALLVSGCEAERAACNASAACSALASCLAGCDDSQCRSNCLQDHASGIPLLYAQYDCERCGPECASSCETQCAGCGGADCSACGNSQCSQNACSDLWNACAVSGPCVSLAQCMANCNDDPSCEDVCANSSSPGGVELYQDVVRCAACSWDTCYDACNGPIDCVP